MSDSLKPPALDPDTIEREERRPYPQPYTDTTAGKTRQALGDALGLTQFGVNISRLAPGAKSALRHWHSGEDEFIYIVAGRPTLVCDSGEQQLEPGHVAGFPAGHEDGHLLENRTDEEAVFIEVGTRAAVEKVVYTDADLVMHKTYHMPNRHFTRRDGSDY